jgi:hypothetical protein
MCTKDVCNTERCGASAPVLCLEGKAGVVGACAVSGYWDKRPDDCTTWCDTSLCDRIGKPCSKSTCDTKQCGASAPVLCLEGPSKDGCATEDYWEKMESCTEWCDTSKCNGPAPPPPTPPTPPPPPPPSKCDILKQRVPPEIVRWRSTENCEKMRKEIAPDLEGECPEYCACSAANSDYPSNIENPDDNSCLFRPGGWGSCCDLTDSKDGPEEHNWRYATNVKGASCYSNGFTQNKPECVIEPLRYLFGLQDQAINGITKGCENWKNARDCLEYEDPGNMFSPCKRYGAANRGPIPKKGEYCFQDFVESRNFEDAEPVLLHTSGYETGACSNSYVPKSYTKTIHGWQWCRPNKNTSNRVCLTRDINKYNYGTCVDTENIGTRDYTYDNCSTDEKGKKYCTLADGECDLNTNTCHMTAWFPGHEKNFKWDEYSQSSNSFRNINGDNDGDIPWEKCRNKCSHSSQKCCD